MNATAAAQRRAAVFIDKDGTLVENVPYNVDPALLRFTPHALAGLAVLARAGFALVVVTNQPGLAMGRFSGAEFDRLRRALMQRVFDEAGAVLCGVHACPHEPDKAGRPVCTCRKPMPGLLREAALEHGLHLSRSWMVGDILDDVEAGRRAGCRSVLLEVGNETLWERGPLREPQHRAGDLLEAARCIVQAEGRVAAWGQFGGPSPQPSPQRGEGARQLPAQAGALLPLLQAGALLPLPLGEGWGEGQPARHSPQRSPQKGEGAIPSLRTAGAAT